MKKKSLTFLFAVSDIFLITMCMFVCASLSGKYFDYTKNIGLVDVLFSGMIWMLSACLFGLYNESTMIRHERNVYKATMKSILVYIVIFQIYTIFNNNESYLNIFLLFFCLSVIFCFLLSRLVSSVYLWRNFSSPY